MSNVLTHFKDQLICPIDKCPLVISGDYLVSTENSENKYPILDEVPIILNEQNSVFSIESIRVGNDTTWKTGASSLRKAIRKYSPSISHNLKGQDNIKEVIDLLDSGSKVLIVGGSVEGPGVSALHVAKELNVVVSDVCVSDLVDIVFDGHDIPFESNTFDLVVVQSVLEHVLDPYRCVAEIHRVLNTDGIVYAETPFIQQIHMKEFDFNRFTDLGHRRLFNHFSEISRGSTGGPGMALAWSYRAFLRSFTNNSFLRSILTIFAHWTSFYLKYFDYYLIDKSAATEASSEYFFIGRKSTNRLSDSDLLDQFRGVKW